MPPFHRMTLPRTKEARPSAAELNARIRELWADGQLPDDRRREYEALVVEWAAAASRTPAGRAA
ncbi:hypothetical protein QCN29_15320 [Streptomyces sp. HNM0663]|uniref:DUF2934 domain-containing protein n=1 Tax=Streptomyces chengmaiensis TaxID=3040919 RepID=A0ABT6HN44_9ACTN|nr:hypothetical protein [Streptomyces chengmaiensis]MDH2390135.1 hypothetical protein [Streptomyces chengmaiensis]